MITHMIWTIVVINDEDKSTNQASS